MKKLIMALCLSFGFLAFGAATDLPMFNAAVTIADECHKEVVCDEVIENPGTRYNGDRNLRLTIKAVVCHPDYDLLNRPVWWSMGIASNGDHMRIVYRVLRGEEVEERIITKRCVEQYVPYGARLITVTPCRIPGYNVWLVTSPITRSGTYEFREQTNLAGKKFPV